MYINIRPAVPEDCFRIRPLQQEIAGLHHKGRPDLVKDEARFFTEETFLERLEDPNHTVLIAETAEGEVVGYVFGWVISVRNHPTYVDFDSFYIDDICILKAYQRNGIGQKIFDICKAKAKELGCKNLELGVWSFNQGAIAFYENCGMKERTRRMEFDLEE